MMFVGWALHVPDRWGARLWTATTAARYRADPWAIELVYDLRLRDRHKLVVGHRGRDAVLDLQVRMERRDWSR